MDVHSLWGSVWIEALGVCVVLGGLSYLWKRLYLPALYLLTVLMFGWFLSLGYRMHEFGSHTSPVPMIIAGLLTLQLILYVIGYYKSRSGQPEASSFWRWFGPRY